MKDSSEQTLKTQVLSGKQIKRRNFIAYSAFVGLNLAAFGAWKLLRHAPIEEPSITKRAQEPLRRVGTDSFSVNL